MNGIQNDDVVQKGSEPMRNSSEQRVPPFEDIRKGSESVPKRNKIGSQVAINHSEKNNNCQSFVRHIIPSAAEEIRNFSETQPNDSESVRNESEVHTNDAKPVQSSASEQSRTAPTCAPRHEAFTITVREASGMTRSLLPIAKDDLRRLGRLAAEDRADFFRRRPNTGALYSSRLFAVALCQGGALHYIDGKNGIKDLDVWSFYTEDPARMFPPRRRAKVDFGDPKFGTTPDSPEFIGRRVDLIGRSIPSADPSKPVETLRRYLASAKTESARLLALKAVVLIEPAGLLGTVVWPAR